MLRAGLVAALLVGVGSTAMASDFGAPGFTRVDEHWSEGRHWDGDRHDWDRRDGDRHDWDRHDRDRHDWDRHEWRQRYWNGYGWVYVTVPPPPYYGWHWDPYRGRYCP
jgi:hypothetical protein